MIGGNITAVFEKKITDQKNEIGEAIPIWGKIYEIIGFLDYMSGDSKYTVHNTKVQESTHIFVSDYLEINAKPEESRMVINNKIYDILLIDNPMELNEHLEIYLKYRGG